MAFRCIAVFLLCVVAANGAKIPQLKMNKERFIHSWADVNHPFQTGGNDAEGSGGNVVDVYWCTGKLPGLYADPDDCTKYYECVGGFDLGFHRECAMGFAGGPQPVFDQLNQICDWPENVPNACGGTKTFTCADKAPGLYSDPQDCHSYYECVALFDMPFHRPCAVGWATGPQPVFDQTQQQCDWPANVAGPCGTKVSLCMDKAPGKYPVPDSCTQYYQCFAELADALERECPVGTMFHPELMACHWPDLVPYPCGEQANAPDAAAATQ